MDIKELLQKNKKTYLNQEWSFIDVKVKTIEPLHIGGAKDPFSDVDNPVAMLSNKPVIPSTSFKGMWRSLIEKHLIHTHPNIKPCVPSTKPSQEETKSLIEKQKYAMSCNNKSICPACYLLGAPGVKGFVRVPFLNTEGSKEGMYSIYIDRATGLGKNGANRNWDVVPPETIFTGTIEILLHDKVTGYKLGGERNGVGAWLKDPAWNDKPESIIQTFIIDLLKGEHHIGGYWSKGCGKIEISFPDFG